MTTPRQQCHSKHTILSKRSLKFARNVFLPKKQKVKHCCCLCHEILAIYRQCFEINRWMKLYDSKAKSLLTSVTKVLVLAHETAINAHFFTLILDFKSQQDINELVTTPRWRHTIGVARPQGCCVAMHHFAFWGEATATAAIARGDVMPCFRCSTIHSSHTENKRSFKNDVSQRVAIWFLPLH